MLCDLRPASPSRQSLFYKVDGQHWGSEIPLPEFRIALVPLWDYDTLMRIIALSTLKAFWQDQPRHQDAKEPALAWYRHALHADWSAPSDIKRDFGTASILQDGRVVFNLAGNKYRLVVWVNYAYRVVYIRFIGTHAQYDKIDVQTI